MSASKPVRKFFLCTGQCVQADQLRDYPGSHIIGELHYVEDEGQRLTALAVYEVSLPSNSIPSVNIRIRAEIIGDARRIKCTYLDCTYYLKQWRIARAAALQLAQRYQL
jgi:hypothetical protein